MKRIEAKQLGDIFYEMTYVKGSLRNLYRDGQADGFTFQLDNPPLALGGVAIDFELYVNGENIPPQCVWITQKGEGRNAGTINPDSPYTFHVGEPSEWRVFLPSGTLPAGENEIVIVTEQYAFGKIYSRFTIRDVVSDVTEPTLIKTSEFHRPLALSNDSAFTVLNWAGDLSADWNWWGLVTDNGGLYGPPARYVRHVKWAVRDQQAEKVYPFVSHTDWAAHLPGRLEAGSVIGELQVSRKVFMSQQETATLTTFHIINNGDEEKSVELVGEVEAMLVPYGLLGVRAKRFHFEKGDKQVVLQNPQLPYVGVLACDRDMEVSFGTEYEGPNPTFAVSIPVVLAPQSSSMLTVVVSGDPESKNKAISVAQKSLQQSTILMKETVDLHNDYLAHTVSVQTGDDELDQAFLFAKLALKQLKFHHPEIGIGVCAGFPRFPNYWSRDSAWTAFAYLAIGDYSFVREVLLNFISLQLTEDRPGALTGDMPTVISGPGFMHQTSWGGSAEGVLLQVILFARYVRATGDTTFATDYFDSIKRSVQWATSMDWDGDLFLEHGIRENVSTSQAFTIPDTQWMDHIDRRKSANDVQGLYWESLRSAAEVAELLGEVGLAEEWRKRADLVEDKYEEVYWNADAGTYYDRILEDGTADPTVRPNYAVNLMFSTKAPPERVASALERLEQDDMTVDFGVRTRSALDIGAGYDPASYQEGAVWNLTTGWTAMAQFKAGRATQGTRYLRMMARRIIDEMGMGAELYRATEPEPLNGCFIQAWSLGMFVWCLVTYQEQLRQ